MISKSNPRQISIDDYMTELEQKLDASNRWVRLAKQIPWDEFREIYNKTLRKDFGRPAKDARLVIGAMIIKSKKSLADEEVIPEIQENPYLQYFVGLKAFTTKPIFDPSLFVTLRKRLGHEAFDELNASFLTEVKKIERAEKKQHTSQSKREESKDKEDPPTHQGELIIDAVVAPQDIKFPTDLDLLNDAREHTERLIDQLWEAAPGERKPRTYRNLARRDYLNTIKKKRKSAKVLRKALRQQLGYVRRNIATIKQLLEPCAGVSLPFDKQELRLFWVIQEVYRQQKTMFDKRENSHPDRIVSLRQPHIRPIVRGKAGKDTEFEVKLSCSLVGDYVYLDHLDWNAFNESRDLLVQVEKYHTRFGFYPEKVLVDQIYGTRENRGKLKELGIRYCGKPLGRPPKQTASEKRAFRRELSIRSRIEGKFGEGKRKYQLDCVKAKTRETSESWIAMAFFVMNLSAWLRADIFVRVSNWLKTCTQWIFDIFNEQFVNLKSLTFE